MSEVGSVGVGLSVAFALFMGVLAVELYCVWTSRQKRRETEMGTQVKQKQTQTEVLWSATWRHKVAARWTILGAEDVKRWAKLRPHSTTQTGAGVVEAVLEVMQGKTLEDGQKQEDGDEAEADEEDVFRVGGLWGPPRLLFTIKEETKEELELEEGSVGAVNPSRHASRASSELLFETSACTSPYVTPPSSPPFTTPFGSPAQHLPLPPCKHMQDLESSSSSTSSSSPRQGHHPLSALFEDTSSFSSSSSAATPAVLSPTAPPPPTTSPIKRQRHPLCLLLDPPPSPSSAFYHYHNRVHPLTSLPPLNRHMHSSYGNPFTKPAEHSLPPFSSFHLPAPSQPTTPCPFRASLNAKSTGFLISPALAPTFHLAEV